MLKEPPSKLLISLIDVILDCAFATGETLETGEDGLVQFLLLVKAYDGESMASLFLFT